MSDVGTVSVVIPTFNRATLIPRSLGSVLRQTHEPFEVIVVDDASTDGTEDAMAKISDPRVRFVRHEENRGPSASRNTGIHSARGELIAFLDSDDEWEVDKLERQLAELRRDPAAGMVYSGWAWIRPDGTTRVSRIPEGESGLIAGKPRWFYNMVQDLVVRRDVVLDCLFDERIWAYENLEWLLRLMHRTRSVFVPEVLVLCYEHAAHRASDSKRTKLEGLDFVLTNYMQELEEHPRALFRLRLTAGALGVEEGDEGATGHLSAAARLQPLSVRPWAWLVRAWLARARA